MDYIRTNKLKAALGSTGKDPSQIRYGSGKIYRMYYSNQIVWDVLRTTFSASDFSIGANGGNVANNSNVTSYGINALGSRESLGWTCDPTTISANSSTSSKTHIIKYTQNGTGDTTTAICTQAGQSIVITGYRYSASVSNESIGTAEASGSTLTLNVSGTIYVYAQYSDGSESLYNSYGFSSTAATITSGTPESGRAYLSNGKVVVYSAGKTIYTGTRSVYYIYGYSFSVDGRSYTGSTYITVQQKQNSASDSYGTPTVSVTYGDVGANGSAASMTVTYSQTKTTTYTSEAPPDTQTLSGTVSNASTSGSVYIYSISSSNSSNGGAVVTSGSSRGNVSANSLEYTAKDRSRVLTVTVTVRANGQNGSKTVDVYQAKNTVSSVFNAPVIGTVTASGIIPATGATGVSISVSYTQTKTTTSTAIPTGKTEQVVNTTVTSTDFQGSTVSNNGRIQNGKVIADKLPAKYVAEAVVFTVTNVTVTSNGKSASKNPNLSIKQAENKLTGTAYSNYAVSLSANNYEPDATVHFVTIYVSATKTKTDTYTSGAQAVTNSVASNAKLSAVGGTLGASTVSNGGNTRFTFNENTTTSSRKLTVTATHADNSTTTHTITITQKAANYSFEVSPTSITFGYGGGESIVNITSTVNNTAVVPTITKNISWASVTGPTLNDMTLTGYTLTITAPANTSTSARSGTIVVKHPNITDTKTITVSQGGKPETPADKATVEMTAWFESTYVVGFTATVYTSTDYVDSNLLLKIQDTPYSDYSDLYGSIEYPSPLFNGNTFSGTISIEGYPPSPAYLAAYVGDEFKGSININ